MGDEAITCDCWIAVFLDHAGFTGPALEYGLVGCGISLSLFGVVL